MMGVIEDLSRTLAQAWGDQEKLVVMWHESTAMPEFENALLRAVAEEHWRNFQLWHVEDRARRTDIGDAAVAECKRRIDALNQERNDCMERVDQVVVEMIQEHLPSLPDGHQSPRYNTESLGAAVDRMSILSLKIYHMIEQATRPDVNDAFRQDCRDKVEVLKRQRDDLARSVSDLVEDYAMGLKRPRIFRQFKMYNDPKLNPELQSQARTDSGGEAL
ncbi:MAG: DUF4254 domain-containing protein [Deltaproteobacteria bacterium]|nr:DUF4254 domain-containing protein [Deltaproteobacteria bacterium]